MEWLKEAVFRQINPFSPFGTGGGLRKISIKSIDPGLEYIERANDSLEHNNISATRAYLQQAIQVGSSKSNLIKPLLDMMNREEGQRIGPSPNIETYRQGMKLIMR